jgi:hypothetical protein
MAAVVTFFLLLCVVGYVFACFIEKKQATREAAYDDPQFSYAENKRKAMTKLLLIILALSMLLGRSGLRYVRRGNALTGMAVQSSLEAEVK